MLDLTKFGSESMPLRPSALGDLMHCNWSAVIKEAMEQEQLSSVAADTGSAVHHGAAVFHGEAKGDAISAVEAMRAGLSKYPYADLDNADRIFRAYAADPRNIGVETPFVEHEIRIRLAPAADDPTAQEIVIRGTLDQVRLVDGCYLLCDIKTGKPQGMDMLTYYAHQQAAYQIGATQALGVPVHRSCIIRTADYFKRGGPGPVFWHAPWGLAGAQALIAGVRQTVSNVRAGRVWPSAGDHCRFCVGLSRCLSRFQEEVQNAQVNVSSVQI